MTDYLRNKSIFISEAEELIHREGISALLNWLESTDFFVAPASTRFHGNYEGGLCEHSLAVYSRMFDLLNFYWPSHEKVVNESAAIVSLFHDLCKVNMYATSSRNVKDPDTGIWRAEPCYTVDERLPFGAHGAKSMFIVMNFMELKPDEASAIIHHMGAWDNSTYNRPADVYNWNRLAWLLHVADEAATYLDKT